VVNKKFEIPCTCDENCDDPCPAHGRENQLQNALIDLGNEIDRQRNLLSAYEELTRVQTRVIVTQAEMVLEYQKKTKTMMAFCPVCKQAVFPDVVHFPCGTVGPNKREAEQCTCYKLGNLPCPVHGKERKTDDPR